MSNSDYRVMVVEDNELNMKLIYDLVTTHFEGVIVRGFRSPRCVIDELTRTTFHVIFLDDHLPEITGTELIGIIREKRLTEAKIIFMTAFAMKGDEERIRQLGTHAYLSKPLSVSKLIEVVHKLLPDLERS